MNALKRFASNFPATVAGKSLSLGLSKLIQDESGQDLIEYALVAALVGLGALTSMSSLANTVSNAFNTVGNNLTSGI
ncbi:pilus assembly protein Flp/PilA [Granulicella rosea]|uniref:Pilus assembly protein Flp/PilA n=1 Tax=Granulicella rosea TaxID=474952 RepID=A0A239D1B7_9BACT|nr:Flp family type IVb pilin [Granulicella rosea]SNS26316.1 pilus assembly protein Flp/PilA [Granulicella rosea]